MFLLEILAALAINQFWRMPEPVHKQPWFLRWVRYFDQWPVFNRHAYLHGLLVIFLPAVAVALIMAVVPGAIAFLLAAAVLVICIGRGEFSGFVQAYNAACADKDWDRAARTADRLGVDKDLIATNDWPKLHERMLDALAYFGFERLFAVIFWFVFFGPFGALVYRLSQSFAQTHPSGLARHWLWALEWMPARLLGASFAVTGNFVGCVNNWREQMLDTSRSSNQVLMQCALGASSVDDELMQSCDVTEREVGAIRSLYYRTLGFWLAVLGLWVIFGPVGLY